MKRFVTTVLVVARETVGLKALPDGADWYQYMVTLRTTTSMTPEQVHQVGLDEVERIHEEMRAVLEQVGFDGNLKEFFEFLNTDDQFYYDEPEQLIQGYRDMSDHIESLAPKLFSIFPRADFEVRAVEPFREQSASGGSYRRGSPDGSRPGVFIANTYDRRAPRELRDRAERGLGDGFDVKAFHTEVLIDGPLPLELLDRKIDRWIDCQQP